MNFTLQTLQGCYITAVAVSCIFVLASETAKAWGSKVKSERAGFKYTHILNCITKKP